MSIAFESRTSWRRDLQQRLADRHPVAHLLQPADDGAFGTDSPSAWRVDFGGYGLPSLLDLPVGVQEWALCWWPGTMSIWDGSGGPSPRAVTTWSGGTRTHSAPIPRTTSASARTIRNGRLTVTARADIGPTAKSDPVSSTWSPSTRSSVEVPAYTQRCGSLAPGRAVVPPRLSMCCRRTLPGQPACRRWPAIIRAVHNCPVRPWCIASAMTFRAPAWCGRTKSAGEDKPEVPGLAQRVPGDRAHVL